MLKLALTKKITASVFEEEKSEPANKNDGDDTEAGDPYRVEIPVKRKKKKKVSARVCYTYTHTSTHSTHINLSIKPPTIQKKKPEVEEDEMETCRHCDMASYGVSWCGTPTNIPRCIEVGGTDEEDGDGEEGTDEEDGGRDGEEGTDEEDGGREGEEGTDECVEDDEVSVSVCIYIG